MLDAQVPLGKFSLSKSRFDQAQLKKPQLRSLYEQLEFSSLLDEWPLSLAQTVLILKK